MKKLSVVFLIPVVLIFLSGCSITTSYGEKPQKLGDDTYKYKVYYNIYSSSTDIKRKAKIIENQIKKEHGYKSCTSTRNENRIFGSQTYVYTAKCFR